MSPYQYPPTKQDDLVEDYHGTPVADPYRWLEDVSDPAVQAWTAEQNQLTEAFIGQIPAYEQIKARLTELWRYPHYTSAHEKGGRLFYLKNNGTQNQPALYMQKGDDPAKLLVDPNALAEDGTVALMNQYYTHDGSLLAYSLAESGSDWQAIHILDVDSGEHADEVLSFSKFPQIAWAKDKRGFFYNRLPDPTGIAPEDRNNYRHVCWHTMGTPQSEDVLVYQHEDKTLSVEPTATPDGAYLLLWVHRGTDPRNGIYYRPFDDEGEFTRLFEPEVAEFEPVGSQGDVFFALTDLDAPHKRIVAVDLAHPAPEDWRTVVPEGEDAMDAARVVDDMFVVINFHHAHSQVKLYSLEGEPQGEIPLPSLGTVIPLSGRGSDRRFYFSFASFLAPDTIYYYDFDDGQVHLLAEDQGIDFPVDEYVTHQEFYTSKDGTQVPIFLTHKKGIELDGQNPTILYGYGGFNLAQPPFFKVWNLTWFEMGGGVCPGEPARGQRIRRSLARSRDVGEEANRVR